MVDRIEIDRSLRPRPVVAATVRRVRPALKRDLGKTKDEKIEGLPFGRDAIVERNGIDRRARARARSTASRFVRGIIGHCHFAGRQIPRYADYLSVLGCLVIYAPGLGAVRFARDVDSDRQRSCRGPREGFTGLKGSRPERRHAARD